MCERGRDEEGEDEGGERPEWPVEVRSGREVGGGVRGREGVERVEAAEEDLKGSDKLRSRVVLEARTVLVSTSKWC